MNMHRLQTRFVLAGCLLVSTTVACGLWSAWTFFRLSAVVDVALQESQETIDLAGVLERTLEREDDALVLALIENPATARQRRREEVQQQRKLFGDKFEQLQAILSHDKEKEMARDLWQQTLVYRAAGDKLMQKTGVPGALSEPDRTAALTQYQQHVNPAQRKALAACEKLREHNFQTMKEAGIKARDEALRATWIVALISVAALGFSTFVSIRLARAVLRPVHELTDSVEALRQGDFERRVRIDSADELGQLADGFNRMAQTLAEYRSSSLGELLVAKTTLEATLDALPDAVIVIDPDGNLAAMNSPARLVLRNTRGDEVQRVEQLPLPPEHLAAVHQALRGQATPKAQTEFNRTIDISLAGNRRKFLPLAVPIPHFTPKRFGAVLVLQDVTDLARLDELRSELVGVASHELKTPLTSVRMNLLLLGEVTANLNSRQQEILATAITGCEELGATIDELLDLTRIEAGQLRLAQDRIDFLEVIDHALLKLRPRFDDARITLEVIPDCRSALVRGDGARLGIVLANLLTNALKYTPRNGRVAIRLWSQRDGAKENLHVSVTDTGPGIPPEYRERVFEKFFRVEHQRSGDGQVRGTGIGLYLCREIIEAHGGKIWCTEGQDGAGAGFTFVLERIPEAVKRDDELAPTPGAARA
jgi:NtrC-family two-component system sensor histidine kinase KinB